MADALPEAKAWMVKAFLVHHGKPYEKTHDIEVLVDLASVVDSRFSRLADAADALTPYATRFRYPNATFAVEPQPTEYDEAFKHAQTVYDFVLNLLPLSCDPETESRAQENRNPASLPVWQPLFHEGSIPALRRSLGEGGFTRSSLKNQPLTEYFREKKSKLRMKLRMKGPFFDSYRSRNCPFLTSPSSRLSSPLLDALTPPDPVHASPRAH